MYIYIYIYSHVVAALYGGLHHRRWLQDTSKRKLADFCLFCAPPPVPVSPGLPEVDPTIAKNKRSG